MGSSEMVSQIAAGITTLLFNITMMRLMGEEGVAALTIVLYAQFIFNAAYMGFSNSAAPIISFNYGRKDVAYLKKTISLLYDDYRRQYRFDDCKLAASC